MAKHPTPAEGHIDHGTAGRVNVERGTQTITLRLWQHSLNPVAVLSFAEAQHLVRNIQAAMEPPRKKATDKTASEIEHQVGARFTRSFVTGEIVPVEGEDDPW